MARRKPKKSTVTSPSAPPTLARSSLHEQYAALTADRAWLLQQIRRKRTELDNFITQMRSITSELFERMAEPRTTWQTLDDEVHRLFTELLTERNFGKQTTQKIQRLYQSLQWQQVISVRAIPGLEDEEEDGDEPFDPFDPFGADGADGADFFGDFGNGKTEEARSPSAKDQAAPNQREMRQTFLRLATKYHPDRATDQDTHSQNTEIMKEINRAYQNGDFARLLELEQQSFEEIADSAVQGDDLARDCEKLSQDNQRLREQYEGIKAELRHLRGRTHEGEIVQVYRQAKREKIDMFAQMVAEIQEEIQELEKIRDFVQDFRDRKMTIKRFLQGPKPTDPAAILERLQQNFGIIIDPAIMQDFF